MTSFPLIRTVDRGAIVFVVLLAAVAVLFFAGPALADDATELERAKTSYDAGRYAEGADRFKEILNPDSPNALKAPNAIERARAYYAACLIALGRTDEANQQILSDARKLGRTTRH